jgi:hypothetical protein
MAADKPTALQRLLSEPKGKTTYTAGEPFMLHVFWEAPSASAASQLLDALHQCADATHRDTPCVPTYFFRVSSTDADLYGEAPKFVHEHRQMAAAIKKLQVGISKAAVTADWTKRGFDPAHLDLQLSDPLPTDLLHQKPVAIELTELYLDERAFMEHAGSKDYLKGYGAVMNPALINRPPVTLRMGTPNASVVEKVLEPMLKANAVHMEPLDLFTVWNKPSLVSDEAFLISLDVETAAMTSEGVKKHAMWCVRYQHPHRESVMRWMLVFSVVPPTSILKELADLKPIRGECHSPQGNADQLKSKLAEAGLSHVVVNASRSVGYVAHPKAAELKTMDQK